MKIVRIFLKSIALVLILSITSCSSEDGEDGVNGIDGKDGVTGATGATGATGQDGNANVISVLFENQTINNGSNNVFDIPELTQEIYDTGFVVAYVTVTGNDYWETLPLSLGQQIILEIDKIEVGKATLKATFTQSNLKLRFILVAGVDANSIDFSNYKEIESLYNLKD